MPDQCDNQKSAAPAEMPGCFFSRSWSPLTLLLLFVCLLQFFLLAKKFNSPAQPSSVLPETATNSAEPYFRGHAGPWGDLVFMRISIEPPADFLPSDKDAFGPTHWYFAGYSPEKLREFFNGCGLPPNQLAALTNGSAWDNQPDGVLITPNDELVISLNESARKKIYSALAVSQINKLQFWPFKSQAKDSDEWFAGAGLSSQTLALVRKLTYRRGDYLCLSDIFVLFPHIQTAAERQNLIKRLCRSSTLLMKLRVKPDTDVDALADYWATGPHNKDIIALLDSLRNFSGGVTIDVAHLLPSFARKRIYTFSPPMNDPAMPTPNCYWTAMNFFNDPPDNRYYDNDFLQNTLSQNYTEVFQPHFGDVIVLYNAENVPIHMAVFIADDVVFTKNGFNNFHPWTLMKWNDLVSEYALDYKPKFALYRPKEINEQ